MTLLAASASNADVYKIIFTVCYSRRRLKRLLHDGPRKAAIQECLVTVVELLTEAIERPPPAFAQGGGLGLLSALAGGSYVKDEYATIPSVPSDHCIVKHLDGRSEGSEEGVPGNSAITATPGELAPGGARPLLSEDGPPAPAVVEQYEVFAASSVGLAIQPPWSMTSVSGVVPSATAKDEGMSDDGEWSEVHFDDFFDVDAYLKVEDDKAEVLQSEVWGGGCTSRVCGGPPR